MHITGHRGARFEAPENTVDGFEYALGLGINHFELDVLLTKDLELVVIHDDTVDRTTNGTGKVAEMTLEEIQSLDARSVHVDWPNPVRVPTLAEVLDVVDHVPFLLIEIKRDTLERMELAVTKAVALIRETGMDATAFLISGVVEALELAQRIAPDIKRGYTCAWDKDENIMDAERLDVSLVGLYYPTATDEVVAWARSKGMHIEGWPTNDEESLDAAIRWQLDTICTDGPTQIRAWAKDRNLELS